MVRNIFAISAGALAFGMLTMPASASYISKCDALIQDWKQCRTTGKLCLARQATIEEHCKCHALKGDEWKLVTAAVGEDGVCRNRITTIEIPPPPPPPPVEYHNPDPVGDPGNGEGDPKGKKGGGDDGTGKGNGGEASGGSNNGSANSKEDRD